MSKKIHQKFLEIADVLSPRLQAAIASAGPRRLRRRNGTPLADVMCRVVAGQQLSTKAASSIWGRVMANAGSLSASRYAAEATSEALRSCGLSAAKAKSMQAIAAASAAGWLDESVLADLSHHERSCQLTSIWGVGKWTADMIGIFYFGDKDVWPDGDVTVCKTLERLTSRRRKTTNTAQRFAPHRSYLALYMYEIADNVALQ